MQPMNTMARLSYRITASIPGVLEVNAPEGDCLILQVLTGFIQAKCEKGYWLLKPMDIILLPCGEKLYLKEYAGITTEVILAEISSVNVGTALKPRYAKVADLWFARQMIAWTPSKSATDIINLCMFRIAAEHRKQEIGYLEIINAYIEIALVSILRATKATDTPNLMEAGDFIYANGLHPGEVAARIYLRHCEDIGIRDVLAEFNMQHDTLARGIVRAAGMNPLKYRNLIRMRVAQGNLTYSDDAIPNIAKGVGINDVKYFGRLFTSIIGVSPSVMRRSARMMTL